MKSFFTKFTPLFRNPQQRKCAEKLCPECNNLRPATQDYFQPVTPLNTGWPIRRKAFRDGLSVVCIPCTSASEIKRNEQRDLREKQRQLPL
jgi:hypothetical protein